MDAAFVVPSSSPASLQDASGYCRSSPPGGGNTRTKGEVEVVAFAKLS